MVHHSLITHVSYATSTLRTPKSLTPTAFHHHPIQYSTQGFQYEYVPQTCTDLREHVRPTTIPSVIPRMAASRILQPRISKKTDRPSRYPKVRPGGPPLREVVRGVFHTDPYGTGWVIRAPLHEEDYEGGANYQSKYISGCDYNFAHTKKRILIVLAEYHYHYLAIPPYTHDDNGLNRKPNQDGFVYVHDKYRVSRRPLKQRKDRHLDAAIDLQTRIPHYRPKSAAHLNESYCGEELLPEGGIPRPSYKRLRQEAAGHRQITFDKQAHVQRMYSLDCNCGSGHLPERISDLDIQQAGLGGLERVSFCFLILGNSRGACAMV